MINSSKYCATFVDTTDEQVGNTNTHTPILVGVTGHRDILEEDLPVLKRVLIEEIDKIRKANINIPIILITPLAEGADRIAAEAALDLRIKYIVPLPMPKEEYEKEFSSKSSIKKFRELYKKAFRSFELPLGVDTKYKNMDSLSKRNLQYYKVGLYIAKYSQILFALWDGIKTGKMGGTSQIVKYKVEGTLDSSISNHENLDPLDMGLVCHIVTPRMSNPNPVGKKYNVIMLNNTKGYNNANLFQLKKRLPKELEFLNVGIRS